MKLVLKFKPEAVIIKSSMKKIADYLKNIKQFIIY